ncbi:MAG TPA: EF-hand domain-containing protein [Pirellulales bacterium]|nr:EF-hand domain-containing protein [Pirellulales bacterium]
MSNLQRGVMGRCVYALGVLSVAALVRLAGAGADEPKPFDPDAVFKRAAVAFQAADRDGDNKVTRNEFLASDYQGNRDERIRLFNEFDFEGDGIFEFDFEADGALDRNEFLKLVSPTDERPTIRDPLADLKEAALAKWRSELAAADRDGDGALARDEWPATRIAAQVPAVAEVAFEQWDRNHDGKVDVADAKWLLEVAYGLTQLDGRALRTRTGRVFSWYFFRSVDSNHDGTLSRSEFVNRLFFGKEKNAILFDKLDADGDGQLTAEETRKFLWHDTLANFFTFDRNLDGFLTTDEFIAIGWGQNLGLRSVRAFDDDGDGRVSFSEFRSTTFANQASDWLRPRHDVDHDGRLSFSEFYLERTPILIAQSRWLFDNFDLDHDGFLSTVEFEFDAGFAKCDSDGDRQLTLQEFLGSAPETEHADRTGRFLVLDFDGNGKLNGEEYDAFSLPVDERGRVPDPMAELADAALAKWEALAAAADRDRDGALSQQEWPADRIAKELHELAQVPFAQWDRAGDGRVNRADARWLVDVAYGLAKLDGQPLRTPNGRMFAWYFFRRHDRDRNDLLSRDEFVAGYHPGNVNTFELFESLDADGDGELTHEETLSVFWHDMLGTFFVYDRNKDGYLNDDEIRAIGWGRYLASRTVPAFDIDGDGKLSFREFRLTNFANQAADWWQLRDLDNDGQISWREFYQEKPPLLVAQSHFFFDRFDRNHDGLLSPFEFPSEADPAHGRILGYAEMLERLLPQEVRFAGHICALSDTQTAALKQSASAAIERLVERSVTTTDKNQLRVAGRGGVGGPAPAQTAFDLAMMRAPHLLLRRELVALLRSQAERGDKASGDSPAVPQSWQKLEDERLQAEKRRKRAASLAHVAMLDERLLLTDRQRQVLCELLAGGPSDAWWQPINNLVFLNTQVEQLFAGLSSDGWQGLFVPEEELVKILTARQLATFKELQQPQEYEFFYAQQLPAKPADAPAAAAGRAAAGRGGAGPQVVQQRLRLRFLRQRPTDEVQLRELTNYVEQRLDEMKVVCALGESARAKLLLAMKLDLARLREQWSSRAPDKLNEGEELMVRKVEMRAGELPPLAIFRGPDSNFEKTLQGRLLEDQKKKLAAVDADRRRFQRQALVATVVAGFERMAGLTAAQWDALAALFGETIADVEVEDPDDLRLECLRRMAQLPFERLQHLLHEFQQVGAQQQHAQLIGSAQQLEAARQQGGAKRPASP